MEQFVNEIPNWYLYSMIPYAILAAFLIWGGIATKNISLWGWAGIVVFLGITPFNGIILVVFAIFVVLIGLASTTSSIISSIFHTITKHYEKV